MMKKKLLIASILGLALGIAEAQQPMQSGQADPRPASSAPGGMAAPNGMPSAGVGQGTADQAAPQSFKGCLTGSAGNWTLASDKGQTLKISGTDDQLSSYNNQQVNIQGTQATDGTVKVASIDKTADSCSNNGQAATSSSTDQNTSTPSATSSSNADQSASSTTTTNTASTTSTTSAGNSVSSTTSDQNSAANTSQGNMNSQTSAATATAPSATTSSNNDQNAGVGASGSNSNAGAGQNSMSSNQSATATTSADQNASATQNANGSNDQNSVRHISDMDQNQNNASSNADQNAGQQKLPQTASPLPLLGLMGLGSLVTGLAARRKK